MLKVELVSFYDLTDEEKEVQPDNGWGKEDANYIKITNEGQTVMILSDAIEPEDKTFSRELGDVIHAIEYAYSIGVKDGKKLGRLE